MNIYDLCNTSRLLIPSVTRRVAIIFKYCEHIFNLEPQNSLSLILPAVWQNTILFVCRGAKHDTPFARRGPKLDSIVQSWGVKHDRSIPADCGAIMCHLLSCMDQCFVSCISFRHLVSVLSLVQYSVYFSFIIHAWFGYESMLLIEQWNSPPFHNILQVLKDAFVWKHLG